MVKSKYFVLPEAVQAEVDKKLKEAFDKYTMKWGEDSFCFLKGQHRKGNYAKVVNRTNERYEPVYRDLWHFFALTGEYESMLLLLFPGKTNESLKCPAMSLKACCNFLRWKRNPKGTVLLDGNNDMCNPVLNVHTNEPMLSEAATYRANKTLDTAGSAIHNVHMTHGHDGSYVEACVGCNAAHELLGDGEVFTGCTQHQANSRLASWYRHGNPTKNQDWIANKSTLMDPNYEPNGCLYIDPADVRDLVDALLATNTVTGLKMIVMILVAVRLFLRADEVVTIHSVLSFVPTLTLRINGFIHAIALKISGKMEKGKELYFNLWRNMEHTDICPLTHLLVYVYKAGIKGGYLFPPDKDLNRTVPPDDGVYLNAETYKQFIGAFKRIADSVLEEYQQDGAGCRMSLHIFRKAGYCFRIAVVACNEKPNYQLIEFDARHAKDSKHARTYIQDAEQHFQYQKLFQNPRMRVPKEERPVHITEVQRAEKDCKRHSDATHLSLFQLSKYFVESLPCGPDASIKDTIMCARNTNPTTLEQARLNFVGSLNTHQLQLYHLMQQAYGPSSQNSVAEDSTLDLPATKKQKKSNTNKKELEGRKEAMKAATIEAKLEKLLEIEQQCPADCSLVPYTDSAQKWIKVTLRPILRCYRNHHNSNKVSFANAWKGKFKADFVKHCCRGASDESCRGAP